MLSKLRNHDFRITPQRLAVLRVLAASKEHPSVDGIYKKVRADFPTTRLTTIYKIVSLLKEINEVVELGFADRSNRYDGRTLYPHPHLVCTRRNKIVDLQLSRLENLTNAIAGETGFEIATDQVNSFGICRECLKKRNP